MKPTVIVTKTGSSFVPRASARLSSPNGEQGETEGLLRYLKSRGDLHVVYFGAHRGVLDFIDVAVQPCVQHLHETSTQADLDHGWEHDIADSQHWIDGPPLCVINVCGPPATFSYPGNPKGSTVQLQGMKYTAPMHNLLRHLKIPRVCVNNDPRSYPRDQEMSYGWPYSRPAALLDQHDWECPMTVGGTPYRRISVHAWPESWGYIEPPVVVEKTRPGIVVAHKHVNAGIRQRTREQAWQDILGEEHTRPAWLECYGEGWPAGPVTPVQVLDLLASARVTPVMGYAKGFYAGKPYLSLACNCVPLLYGDGSQEHTYDPAGKLLPLDHELRIVRPGDFYRLAERADLSWLEFMRGVFVPRWHVLDALLDCLIAGRELGEQFGGYHRCS